MIIKHVQINDIFCFEAFSTNFAPMLPFAASPDLLHLDLSCHTLCTKGQNWKRFEMMTIFKLFLNQNCDSYFIGEIKWKSWMKTWVWLCSAQLVSDSVLKILKHISHYSCAQPLNELPELYKLLLQKRTPFKCI